MPVGKRVLWAVLSDGKPLDPSAIYTVAANDFMQVGGDGYTALTKMTNVVSREQLWEVAANYVKSLGTVDPKVEGRVIAAQPGQPAPTPPTASTPVLPTPASILPTAVPVEATATTAPVQATATSVPVQATTVPVLPTVAVVQPTPTRSSMPGLPHTGTGDGLDWLLVTLTLALLVITCGLFIQTRKATK